MIKMRLIMVFVSTICFLIEMRSFEDVHNCQDCHQLFDQIENTFQSLVFERMAQYMVAQKICFEGVLEDGKCYENIKIMTPQFLSLLLTKLQSLKSENCSEDFSLNLNASADQNLEPSSLSKKYVSVQNSNFSNEDITSQSKQLDTISLKLNQSYSNKKINSHNIHQKLNFLSNNLSQNFLPSFQNQNQQDHQKQHLLNIKQTVSIYSNQISESSPLQCLNTNLNQNSDQKNNKLSENLSVQDLACTFCQYLAQEVKNGKSCQQACNEFQQKMQTCNQFCQQDLQLFSKYSHSPEQTCINLSVCTSSNIKNIDNYEEQK
eukprot:TRINITY_DN7949_c0_g1_i1.p1 TRINITY_DN7949_c0_g1~~TRINITY_DN7949_c0_g1_i1.p1  ORF type:complete len:319 (+),score=11.21 TRINITY_DN7949_c0_g1_i1:100-1056(+)